MTNDVTTLSLLCIHQKLCHEIAKTSDYEKHISHSCKECATPNDADKIVAFKKEK